MNLSMVLLNGMWAGLFSTAMGLLLTAPIRFLIPTFVCGFAGRFVRDVLMGWGMNQNWSTVVGAAVVVLIAVPFTQRQRVSAVVLVCGILPLGAAVAMLSMIFDLIKVSNLTGEDLNAAAVSLSANTGKAFVGTLSIALGLGVGLGIAWLFRREEAEGV